MGSPLCPIFAKISAGYYEKELLRQTNKPVLNFRRIDDNFVIFNEESNRDSFLLSLHSLRLCLNFF